jgi:hypothetical protein
MEQMLTLSGEAYEQAAMYELGEPISEYPPQSAIGKIKKAMLITGLLTWLILTAISIGLFFLISFLAQPTFFPSDGFEAFYALFERMVPWFFLFVPILLGIVMLRNMRLRVRWLVICTRGILTLRGSGLEATKWEQITAIYPHEPKALKPYSSTDLTIIYRVKRSNGSPLSLNPVRGAQVEAQYVEAYAPVLLAQYKSSTPLILGKLSLDFMGITRKNRTLPWYEFEGVRPVQNPSRLTILQREHTRAWTMLRPQDVPSLALVERVIEQIQSE